MDYDDENTEYISADEIVVAKKEYVGHHVELYFIEQDGYLYAVAQCMDCEQHYHLERAGDDEPDQFAELVDLAAQMHASDFMEDDWHPGIAVTEVTDDD